MRPLQLTMIAALLALALSRDSSAETLTYSSGTGFYITHDGYVLTNHHVVSHCAGPVSVYQEGQAAAATIAATDAGRDLALLKASPGQGMAAFHSARSPLSKGDAVVIAGYPGQSWRTQDMVTRAATLIDTKGPGGEEKWLQFSDSLAKGNSGGPLLDGSGNVVGVVVAKAEIHRFNEHYAGEDSTSHADLAISLPEVRRFLEENNVRYEEADSGLWLSTEHVASIAQRFVVNVRCQYSDQNANK